MRRALHVAITAALLLAAERAQPAEVPLPTFLQVLGSVTNAARPVANALIIALNLQSFDAIQTHSALDGSFSLPPLPAGIYKIIAVKPGFVPTTATLLPTKADQSLKLRLETEKQARGRDANQEMWEIRGSLPPNILHEIDDVLATPAPVAAAALDVPRLRGEMSSMTGVSDTSANPALAQTAVGVHSRIGDSWQLGIRGNLHRVDDPNDGATFGTPLAESSVMSMELRSSPTDTYRLASSKSMWRYNDGGVPDAPARQADLRSHNFEWEHGDARVQVRYLAQQNLFASNPLGSNLIEIAGDTPVFQTSRNDVGVSLRVTQESLHDTAMAPVRMADLSANASFSVVPSFIVHYGMSSRLGVDGSEWAPRTGAEWKLTKSASIIASGMYKVFSQAPTAATALPMIVMASEEAHDLPRYAYSFGIVSNADTTDRFAAIATVSMVDTPLRMVFNDGSDPFWDGLYVDAGDTRRDLRISYRKTLGRFAVDMSTSAGTACHAASSGLTEAEKVYITADLQSTYSLTGTTLAASYRQLQQPQPGSNPKYRSDRMNLHIAQSLHLPLDLKLLLGFEVGKAEHSPLLIETIDPEGVSRRYLGGIAVNF
jgi:hypothetical protein